MNQVEIKKRQMETASHVLEMITFLVLGNILGDNGIAYLAVAVECFVLFWTIAGSKTADVLGRLLRARSVRGQYKNAGKLRRNIMFLEGITGLLGSVLLFAGSGLLGEKVFGLSYSVVMIRILAPVVFLRALVSVLLGYFQGEGTELPSVISYVMRQVCILGFSVLFANLFEGYGHKVSALLRQENFTAMYGGMGVSAAVLISELFVFIFLFLVYRGSRGKEKRSGSEGMRATDTFASQASVFYGSMLPLILISVLKLVPVLLGLFFFRKSVKDIAGMNDYGVLCGKYLPVMGILLLPACALLLESACRTAGCIRKEEKRYARGNFSGGLHMAVIYGMFFSVFPAVFAPQLSEAFCGGNALAAGMFRFGSFLILFGAAGFYFSEIQMLLGGRIQIFGTLVVFDLVYGAALVLFLKSGAGILSLIYAGLIAGAVYVLAAGALLLYQRRLGADWLQGVGIPAGAACVTGLLLFLTGRLFTPHLGALVTIVIGFVLGQGCYWSLLLLLHNFKEQELNYIPCGGLIRRLGRLLRVL